MIEEHVSRTRSGFSLIELLVATAIFGVMLVILLSMIGHTSEILRESANRIDSSQGGRRALDLIVGQLEQATLNTYWGYDNPDAPTRYERKSELHFFVATAGVNGVPGTQGTGQAVFFVFPKSRSGNPALQGVDGLLCASGFYVEFGSDASWMPAHVNTAQSRTRFRLMQWVQNTEDLAIFEKPDAEWVVAGGSAVPIADNVIALIVWPREDGDPATRLLDTYSYDSRNDTRAVAINQIPPVIQIAIVTVDEVSAVRMGNDLKSKVDTAMAGLFIDPPGTNFEKDLTTLESRLTAAGVGHHSFVSVVPVREAKWSPGS